MSNYVITFYNREKKEWRSQDVMRMTFSEAVMFANKQRNNMGFDWEISCVAKTNKDK